MSEADIDKYLKRLEANNDDYQAHFCLGKIYLKKTSRPGYEEFNQTINIEPDYLDAYKYTSEIYYIKGNNDLALEELKEAMFIEPNEKTSIGSMAIFT